MNRLKGPKIELSQLKVPRVVRDVYQDLRDRRLLPLVALVLVAIFAVPFLLSSGRTEVETPLAPIAPEAGAQASSIEVVKATPGLREPGKRLSGRRAKDPFQQQFVGAPVSSEKVVTGGTTTTPVTGGEGSGSSGSATEPAPAPVPNEPSSGGAPTETGGNPGSAGGGGSGSGNLVFFTYAAKVKIVKTETAESGKKVTSEPEERDRVLPSTVLPSPKQQVVTYMGISPKTRKPLLLVSTDVTAIFGEGKCASGTDTCQLLEVEPTFPETFV
ncbi:MAG TPA: hypothetical protein VFP21_04000, partial [Solirubrobacterales bacterium]|nr:hypothetical protein [Solirubrobacterales bacterium]